MNAKDTFYEIRNYLAGQFIGVTRDEAILDEVIKCLFVRHSLVDSHDVAEGNHTERAKFFRKMFKKVVGE